MNERVSQFHPNYRLDIPPLAKVASNDHGHNYYECPSSESFPLYEQKIYKYLNLHNIRMASPSMSFDIKFTKERTSSLTSTPKKIPTLIKKRSHLKSVQSYAKLSINLDSLKESDK